MFTIEQTTDELLTAVQEKNKQKVEVALKNLKKVGGNISSQGTKQQTPLHIACCSFAYNKEVLALFLEDEEILGEKLIEDGLGWTAVHYAAYTGCEEALQDLIEFAGKKNKYKLGFTDRTAYATGTTPEDRKNATPMTPLELVQHQKPTEVALYKMVERNVGSFLRFQSVRRKNVKQEIEKKKLRELRGVNFDADGKIQSPVLKQQVEQPREVTEAADILLKAVEAKNKDQVEEALKNLKKVGGNISSQGTSKQTGLHLACFKQHYSKEVLSIFLKDKELIGETLIQDGWGWTAVHYAAYSGCEEALEDLTNFAMSHNKYKLGFNDPTAYPPGTSEDKRAELAGMTPLELVQKLQPENTKLHELVRKYVDGFLLQKSMRRKGKQIPPSVQSVFSQPNVDNNNPISVKKVSEPRQQPPMPVIKQVEKSQQPPTKRPVKLTKEQLELLNPVSTVAMRKVNAMNEADRSGNKPDTQTQGNSVLPQYTAATKQTITPPPLPPRDYEEKVKGAVNKEEEDSNKKEGEKKKKGILKGIFK